MNLTLNCANLSHPVYFLKIQQASGAEKKYAGPGDVVKKLYKESGIRGVYKGTCATLMRGKYQLNGQYWMVGQYFKVTLEVIHSNY